MKGSILKNLSLKLKLSGFFVLLVVLPIIIVSAFMYLQGSILIKDQISESSEQLSEQVGSRAETLLEDLNNFTSVFLTDELLHSSLEKLLDSEHDGSMIQTEAASIETINRSIEQLKSSKKGISKISLVLIDGSLFENGAHSKDPIVKDAVEVYKSNLKSAQAGYLNTPIKNEKGKYEISYIRDLVNEHNGEYLGIIKVDFNIDTITDMYKDIKLGEGAYQFIYKPSKNKLVTPPNNDFNLMGGGSFKGFSEEQKKLINASKEGHFDTKFMDRDVTLTFTTFDKLDWKIISVIPRAVYYSQLYKIRNMAIAVSVVFIILALLASLSFSASITKSVEKLLDRIKMVAKGNLNQFYDVSGKDEIEQLGGGFNNMVENITSLVSEVNKASNIVLQSSDAISNSISTTANTSTQIASVTQELAAGASKQALTAQQAVNYVSGLSSDIAQISGMVEDMGNLSSDAKKISESGIKIIEKLNNTTSLNKEISNEVSRNIYDLDANAKKISQIITVIDSISGQINLLSLNAAIESARAGEYGRGFAVVADEIRKLAEQSKEATKNITSIVRLIGEKTDNTVLSVKKSTEIAEVQVAETENTSKAFVEVVKSMDEIINRIYSVTNSIQSVVKSNELVTNSMNEIFMVSQDSAASAQEVSATIEQLSETSQNMTLQAKELNELASNLIKIVSQFKINS